MVNVNIELNHYSNIIFDCDGVILDSNEIKHINIRNAIRNNLPEETAETVIQYFYANPGIPREQKLKKYISDEALINKILENYNTLNLIKLKESQFVDGVFEFIKLTGQRQIRKYVVSGGDQNELMDVFNHKSITHYFDKILGGPKTKSEHLEDIRLKGNTIYFGDSDLDYLVSKDFGCDFVLITGYANDDHYEIAKKALVPSISNFKQIIVK